METKITNSYEAKGRTNAGDLSHTYVTCYDDGTTSVCQTILTDRPDDYLEYEEVRKFLGRSVICKIEYHTDETWLMIADCIRRSGEARNERLIYIKETIS